VSALRFCFTLHVHQPVGNFDHVFREHADEVYRPFLDFLEAREIWPIGLHVSGPLVEWLEAHDSSLLDRIGRHVSDGHIELLGAGWYEPILAVLSREDRLLQIAWTQEALYRRFGTEVQGLWLTERVWEPDLVPDLAAAGVRYAFIDDHLARRAGAGEEDLRSTLRTEWDGQTLDLLAIDEGLRYLIPFRPAAELEADLRQRHEAGHGMALYADDGEKFGGWPRTREWLYEGGWLESFGDGLDRLRNDGIVGLVTPSELHDTLPVTGPFDVPVGSYPEMERWSEGSWRNFLTKYSEAGRLQARMAALSRLCRERGDPTDVRRSIGRGQCNDCYWHGVFGGLYMKHLRQGVRRELAGAEALLRVGESLQWEAMDLAGERGWWVHSSRFSAWIAPGGGGTLVELVHFGVDTDLTDVLTRRIEPYHREALQRASAPSGESAQGTAEPAMSGGLQPGEAAGAEGVSPAAPSIHHTEKTAMLTRLPASDPEDRRLVSDRFLGRAVIEDEYREGRFDPLWVWSDLDVEGPRERDGALEWSARAVGDELGIRKTLRLDARGEVDIRWTWNPGALPDGSLFAPELSLGRPATLDLTPPTESWTYPIITVSKCPDGFEEIEQGTSVTPRWPASLGHARLVIRAPDSAA
jgi:alpha-amylase